MGDLVYQPSTLNYRPISMTLTDEQKATVLQWIANRARVHPICKSGSKRSFQISLTYLETRLLADDLKLNFVEPEVAAEPVPAPEVEKPIPTGKVSVTIDQITRPGAMISGRATFSATAKPPAGIWTRQAGSDSIPRPLAIAQASRT